jgi:hypothetical protein
MGTDIVSCTSVVYGADEGVVVVIIRIVEVTVR